MRWGLGPVFLYECLANSRRWQTYALRAVGVASLLFAMATIAWSERPVSAVPSARDYAQLGESYFYALIGVELALVMLASPAATAGAICLDRARGTLSHMLMTDLSDTEIVLGKLGARMLPVMGLVACSWPVMAISTLLGGIDPIALTLGFAIIVAVAILGCTVALVLSVWARKTHEVILATYTFFIAGMLFWPIWEGLSTTYGAAPTLDALVRPVLYGVRSLRGSRQGRPVGLPRLLRPDSGDFGLAGLRGGPSYASGREPRLDREEQGAPGRPDRPDHEVVARSLDGSQSGALEGVASLAALSPG